MAGIGKLLVDGNVLKDEEGNLVAEINKDLGPDRIVAYANAFAAASEMIDLLRNISDDAVSEFRQQYKSAMDFNNQPIVPSFGPTAMNVPELPNWLKEALSLIVKVDGNS